MLSERRLWCRDLPFSILAETVSPSSSSSSSSFPLQSTFNRPLTVEMNIAAKTARVTARGEGEQKNAGRSDPSVHAKPWTCLTCGQVNPFSVIDCILCGKVKPIDSAPRQLFDLGDSLLSALLESLDVNSVTSIALEGIASGLKIFRPLCIEVSYPEEGSFRSLLSIQSFVQKYALRSTSGQDHAMEILVALALAVGDVTSLLTLGTIFLGAGKEKKIRSRSLLLKLVMCFDQLVGQINTRKQLVKIQRGQ